MERFGSSGARGPVTDDLTPSTVLAIAQAAVTHWGVSRVAIGRDVRVTGESLAAAATAGASSAGATVASLGIVPTPAVQAYADEHDMPAIVVTASHNPPSDNGVKLIAPDGGEVAVADYQAVEARLQTGDAQPVAWDRFGGITHVDDVANRYVEQLIGALDHRAIADAELKVVVDAGTGAGGQTTPTLCRRLGCDVLTLNAQYDGHFPARPSEPVPEVLGALAATVEATGADLGVAHDGDADRAVFVDEHGEVVDGGAVLAALAAAVTEPGDAVVAAISAPQSVASVATQCGATLELTRVGAVNVLDRVRDLQRAGTSVSIAGEQNGGIIVPPYRLARDGAYTLGRFLELVVEQPVSELVAPYTERAYLRRDIHVDDGHLMERAKEWASTLDGAVTELDGIRIDLDDRWVLVRESGTEPLVRIYAEAPSEAAASALLDEAETAIGATAV